MRFPVQKGQSKNGLGVSRGQCPVCKGALSGEPGSFVFLNGGALKQVGKDRALIAPDLIGFLSIGRHGAHGGEVDEPSARLDIADGVPMGQFEYYFCSTSCLRGFFTAAVDALEQRLLDDDT